MAHQSNPFFVVVMVVVFGSFFVGFLLAFLL